MRWLAFIVLAVLAVPAPAHAQDQATVVATCGAAHLTPGTQAFRQVDTNGVTCSGAGTSAVVSSVWSATDAAANAMTLTNGGKTVNVTPGSLVNPWQMVRGNIGKTSGKVYVELATSTGMTGTLQLGIASAGVNINTYFGQSNYSGGFNPIAGSLYESGVGGFASSAPTSTPAANDVYAIAIDFTAGLVWLSHNNVWQDSGNPAVGTGSQFNFVPATTGAMFPAMAFSTSGSSGVWTLQPTAASQKYAPPAGFTAWDSGGATGCSQATAYLARATGETAHAADLTALICGLVTDGVWPKLDALYVLAQQTQADALLNLVSTSYTATTFTNGAAIPFTTYVGFGPFNGVSNSYIDTHFNPSTAPSPNLTATSANYGLWINAIAAEPLILMGVDLGSGFYITYTDGNWYPRINHNAATGLIPNATTRFFAADQIASNVYPYQNGLNSAPIATGAPSVDTSDILVGGTVTTSPSSRIVSEAHIGASLGSAGQLALYTRLRTYMTSIGVP